MHSEIMILLANFGSLFQDTLIMVLVLFSPFVVFAIVIHWLERAIQFRLSERFGWKAVLWTGWLGTPIHELSHVVMCWLFGHQVDEIALFEPDRESGRLGYVKHSYRKGNWYEEFGNLFIGIAPLIGGSLALAALLWLFYPEAAMAAVDSARDASTGQEGEQVGAVGQVMGSVWAISKEILLWPHLFTIKFWAFVYLVLCVGSHMAPSLSDYQGGFRGFLMLGLLVSSLALILAIAKTDVSTLITQMIGLLSPVFAIFGLTIILCFIATFVVYVFTAFIPRFFR